MNVKIMVNLWETINAKRSKEDLNMIDAVMDADAGKCSVLC